MPACVDEKNITLLHIRALFNVFRREKSHIIKHIAEINDYPWTIAPLYRDLVYRLAFCHKMPRRIEVRAHMIRSLYVLRVNAMLRFAFDIFHLKRRIKGPKGTVLVQILREVVDFGHEGLLWVISDSRIRDWRIGWL